MVCTTANLPPSKYEILRYEVLTKEALHQAEFQNDGTISPRSPSTSFPKIVQYLLPKSKTMDQKKIEKGLKTVVIIKSTTNNSNQAKW